MEYTINHQKNEQNDRRKSAIITIAACLLVLLLIYFYKFTRITPKTEDVVTTMLINFGDNRNGNQVEEPANQEGSLASNTMVETTQPQPSTPPTFVEEKIITGKNTKFSTPKTDKKSTTKNTSKSTSTKRTNSSSRTSNRSKNTQGDGRGTAAVGNLIRGRGNTAGTQGTNGTTGNSGDPLGGDGNGESKIGVDRNLIAFIPGTMGRGGAQPANNCSTSGTITISYTVDKAGNVVSARRSGGISDGCVVSTSVAWVKQYVKAEKANTSSSGTYKITF